MIKKNDPHQALIAQVVTKLCEPESYDVLARRVNRDVPLPSVETLSAIVDELRTVLFPGFFGPPDQRPETMAFAAGATLDTAAKKLVEEIKRGLCFACEHVDRERCDECISRAREIVHSFVWRLPEIRDRLHLDAFAAYEGDPAASRPGEAIYCYPSIRAMTNHRLSHELYKLGVPLIPRILSEIAHSETGIDIHPGAEIGDRFFMDHGTGIVIGQTTVIGNNVTLYQGVTLGAKSFPLDAEGNPIKGIPRHPIVEDDVIIYAGATILGRVTIGKGAVIGGNVWVTRNVPAASRIIQGKPLEMQLEDGAGI